MPERVTLRDVAREAGVHTSTASRALNPGTRMVVNPETVKRVMSAAERLGYRPHPLARGLRTNRTMTVGIVIPDIENPLFAPIIGGAEETLGGSGYPLLIGNTDNDEQNARAVVTTLVERRVDGLILAIAARHDGLIDDLVTAGVAVVLVNRYTEHAPVPSVVGDDHAGMGLAVGHLVSLGHTAIGHVAGPRSLSTGNDRAEGFIAAMSAAGLPAGRDVIEEAEWFQLEPGHVAAAALLERRRDLTAIVAGNDLLALGCYQAVTELGMRVGKDMSVTGYNDMPFVDLMQPPMTAVRVPYRAMGVEAARRLLTLMAPDGERRPESIRLAPSLSGRASTAPPRRNR